MTRRSVAAAVAATLATVGFARPAIGQAVIEREPLQSIWERALPPPTSVAVAPDGSGVAVLISRRAALPKSGSAGSPKTLGADQKLRLYDRKGVLLWDRWIVGCSRILLARRTRLVAAFAPRSPLARTLYLWDGSGRRAGEWTYGAAIASAAIADDGGRLLLGTLSGEVSLLRKGVSGWQRSGWQVEPPIRHVAFGPEGTCLIVGGMTPFVARFDAGGRLFWRESVTIGAEAPAFGPGVGPPWLRGATTRPRIDVATSAEGHYLAVAGETNRFGQSEVQLWSARGRLLWRIPIAGRAPTVRLSDSGERLVVGYERFIPTGGPPGTRRRPSRLHFERFLTCYDAAGTEQWHKGGAFFSPLLLGLESRGDWVLSLGRQSKFWLLGRTGENRWRSLSPAPVQLAVGSRDGLSAAAYRTDGRLMYLGVRR